MESEITKEFVLNKIANSKEYLSICKTISKGSGYADDLWQEMFIVLHEYSGCLTCIYQRGEMKYFIAGLLTKMLHSNTSEFQRKVIGKKIDTDYFNAIYQSKTDQSEKTISILQKLNFKSEKELEDWIAKPYFVGYEKTLLLTYIFFCGENAQEVQRQLKINHKTAGRKIKSFIKELKQEVEYA